MYGEEGDFISCCPIGIHKRKRVSKYQRIKKQNIRAFTPAQAHKRYMKDFIEIKVRMKAEKLSIIQEHAASMEESATAFINWAIDETTERDNHKQE